MNMLLQNYETTMQKNILFIQKILYCSYRHFLCILPDNKRILESSYSVHVPHGFIDTAHMNNWKHYDMYHEKVDSKKFKTFY